MDEKIINNEILKNFIQKIYLNNDEKKILFIKSVDREILKLQNTISTIKTEDFMLTKEFFKSCNIPFIDAEGEAEATCCALAKQGYVSAVLTEDTDVLAYGVPIMLHKIDYVNQNWIEINYDMILEELNLTSTQFLDFCILCSTDYNHNLYKIGPEKAYKLISEVKSIDNISKTIDISILNHKRVREIFNKPILFPFDKVSLCGFPNKEEFEKLYFLNNCKFDIQTFYKSLTTSIFHDFEDEHKQEDEIQQIQQQKFLLVQLD
jgi:5'-3' exonuclease